MHIQYYVDAVTYIHNSTVLSKQKPHHHNQLCWLVHLNSTYGLYISVLETDCTNNLPIKSVHYNEPLCVGALYNSILVWHSDYYSTTLHDIVSIRLVTVAQSLEGGGRATWVT